MKDPFLEHCGGWTPAPDILTRNYGFETAYTWGRIRRLCQLGGGTFTASHEAIGKRIGMSRRALIEILKVLILDGYIEDLTPGVRNKAHTYSVKKGEAKILTGMQISHTEDDIPTETPNPDALESDVGMRNLHTEDAEIAHLDDAGMQELPNRYAKNAHPGMQNLHLKRESLETKEERESHAHKLKRIGEVDYLNQNRLFAVKLSEICGNPGPEYVVNGDRKKLAEATAQLLDFKATIEALEDFRKNYWKFDDPPWVGQVSGQWGRYLSSKSAKPRNGTHPANKSSPPLSAEKNEAARLLREQDAKEIYTPGS